MIICGAGGHAKELMHCFPEITRNAVLFDNVNGLDLLGEHQVIHSREQLKEHFKQDNRFALGIGLPKHREMLYQLMQECGGVYNAMISRNTDFGLCSETTFQADVFPFSFIGPDVQIGLGTLINTRASVHHDAVVGRFCEIGPGAIVLGNAIIGDGVQLGSGSVVLPHVCIAPNAIVAAGAVVTRNVDSSTMVAGVPAIVKKNFG